MASVVDASGPALRSPIGENRFATPKWRACGRVSFRLVVVRTLPDVGTKKCRGSALHGVMAGPLERVACERLAGAGLLRGSGLGAKLAARASRGSRITRPATSLSLPEGAVAGVEGGCSRDIASLRVRILPSSAPEPMTRSVTDVPGWTCKWLDETLKRTVGREGRALRTTGLGRLIHRLATGRHAGFGSPAGVALRPARQVAAPTAASASRGPEAGVMRRWIMSPSSIRDGRARETP